MRLVDACNELHHLWKLVDKRCAMKCGDQPLRAGPRKYAWDGPDGDDPNVCARDYVHNTFASAKAGFADRSISPAPDAPKGHPDGFRPFAKRTCTRLVRVWAHTYVRRADLPQTGRGGAAAATRIVRGNGSRRRRGCDADSPRRRVAAAPRLRRG